MEKFLRTRRADVIEGFQHWQRIIFSLCFSSSGGESFAHNSSTWLILRNVCIRKHRKHFICSHWQCCYHCCCMHNLRRCSRMACHINILKYFHHCSTRPCTSRAARQGSYPWRDRALEPFSRAHESPREALWGFSVGLLLGIIQGHQKQLELGIAFYAAIITWRWYLSKHPTFSMVW